MASAIILLPFYIAYLPTEVYGVLSICLAFSIFIQILVTYSFDSSIYIHYHELRSDPQKLSSFISSAFIFMLILGLIVCSILSLAGPPVFNLVLDDTTLSFYPYGFVSVGIGVFQAIFKVHAHLLQTQEKPVPFFWSNVISFGIIAVTTIVGLKLFPGTLVGPLGGRLLATLLSALWVFFSVFREYGIHFKSPWQTTSFSFNAYMFVYQLQQWVINYIDRFIILVFMPVAAVSTVGLYEFAIKCLAPVELLQNGLNASVFPRVIKLINKQEGAKSSTPDINRYFYGQLSVIMLAICFSIIVLPWLVEWFIQKSDFAKALRYVPYLAVIFILRAMRLYFVLPYNILKKMRELTVINFTVSLIKIGLTIVLILQWHLFGVIISSALAYGIEMILLWYYLKESYTMKFNAFKLMIGPLLLFFLIVLVEPFYGTNHATLVHLGYGAICALLLWFAYRNEIKVLEPLKLFK